MVPSTSPPPHFMVEEVQLRAGRSFIHSKSCQSPLPCSILAYNSRGSAPGSIEEIPHPVPLPEAQRQLVGSWWLENPRSRTLFWASVYSARTNNPLLSSVESATPSTPIISSTRAPS